MYNEKNINIYTKMKNKNTPRHTAVTVITSRCKLHSLFLHPLGNVSADKPLIQYS